MDVSQIAKSTQEQATASWINQLNQLRLDRLIARLASQDINLENALNELNNLKLSILEKVVEKNRGGEKGMHGFIAERAHVAIENARKLIIGAKPEYLLIDDNGVVDYLRGGEAIQQKFRQLNLGFNAILAHCKKYPDYVPSGGIYQIPKDYYEKFISLVNLTPEEAGKLPGKDYTLWKNIQQVIEETGIDPSKIEPAVIDYAESQRNAYEKTIDKEEASVKNEDKSQRDQAHQESKPTLQEGLKATAAAAAIEGGMSFCLGVAKKLKSGKKLNEFTEEDWKELGIDSAKGTGKGAIRGASIYGLTNFTATPAAVASALVTASFGICAQANLLRQGKISNEDFIINSEVVCLDVTVSAVASVIGQVAIPVPILGAVVGNVVGMFMYGIAKDNLSKREQQLIAGYKSDIDALNAKLDEQYKALLELLKQEFAKFQSVAALAFDLDVNIAFAGSVELAQFVGVKDDQILKNKDNIDAFFVN